MKSAGLGKEGQFSSVHWSGKPPSLGRASPRISTGIRNERGDVGNRFVIRNCRTPLSYPVLKTYRRARGFTGSYFSMRSSASFRFVSFASRIAFIALTYCLKVGDKRLEISAFSIEMTAFGRSGFVNVKYNATFAPLDISS